MTSKHGQLLRILEIWELDYMVTLPELEEVQDTSTK